MTIKKYQDNPILRKQIENYLINDYAIFPLIFGEKRPEKYMTGWDKLTVDQSKLLKPKFDDHSSFGVVIPSTILILDVDNHDETNSGSSSILALEKHYGFSFISNAKFSVKTARNGFHLYYKLPAEFSKRKYKNALKDFPGVEFKTVGRYVVIPDSEIVEGKYMGIRNDLKNLSELPENFLKDISRVAKETAAIAAADIKDCTDLKTDLSRFQEKVDNESAVKGDLNNTLYRLTCEAKNLGLSPKKVLPILAQWQAEKTGEIFAQEDKDKLKVIIGNAFKYSSEGVATKSVATIFGKVEKMETSTAPQPEVEVESVEELWTDKLIKTKKGEISRGLFGTRNTEICLANMAEFKAQLALNLFTMDTVWKSVPAWRKGFNSQTLKQEIENPEDSDKIERNPPLTDDDIIAIRGILNDEDFDPSPNQIHEATRSTALSNPFHPVKDYFDSLPEWDGVERLKDFFPRYCGTSVNPYHQEIGKKIFTAIVTRIYIPGAKFDYTPVLIGGQGKAKSSFIKAMAIRPSWFSDSLGDIENKDVILQMRSKLIIENAEMAMTSKKAVTIQKAFLSRSVDRARMPYERLPRDVPRQCIFIATTNEDRFLIDETGGRRFWPVEIVKLDIAGVRKNIDLFYAEALHLFKKGEMIYLTPEVEALAAAYQSDRFVADEWQDKIEAWLEKEDELNYVKGADVWVRCLGRMDISSFDMRNQKRIGNCLKALGWAHKTLRVNGKVERGYARPKKD